MTLSLFRFHQYVCLDDITLWGLSAHLVLSGFFPHELLLWVVDRVELCACRRELPVLLKL